MFSAATARASISASFGGSRTDLFGLAVKASCLNYIGALFVRVLYYSGDPSFGCYSEFVEFLVVCGTET